MNVPAVRTAIILFVLVAMGSDALLAGDDSLTTDLGDGVALAEFGEGRIQWSVLVGTGDEAVWIDEELYLDVSGEDLEILCTVENLRDPDVPLRDVRIEIVPPAQKAMSSSRVARAAGPGGSRTDAARSLLGIVPLPDPQASRKVARGSRTPDRAGQPQATTLDIDLDSYQEQLRVTPNAGFVSMVEEQGFDQGLEVLNIFNPTAQGRWRVKVTGNAGDPFIVVARATPIEMSAAEAAVFADAADQLSESIGHVLEEITAPAGEVVSKASRGNDDRRVAMGVPGWLKCDACCACDRTIILLGLTYAVQKIWGTKARQKIAEDPEVQRVFFAYMENVMKNICGALGLRYASGWVGILRDRDPFCYFDNMNKLICHWAPRLLDFSPYCPEVCLPEDGPDKPGFPAAGVDPDLDQDWLTQATRWQAFDRDLVCAQTFTVSKRGILREIELGISQQSGGADEQLRLQIARVDASGRPSRSGQDVLVEKWLHPGSFSVRPDPDGLAPGPPGQPGTTHAVGQPAPAAAVDLYYDQVQVFPGETLAIVVTHRGARSYAWSYEDGYADGQSFTRPVRGGGWTPRGGDFSFRTYVRATDSPGTAPTSAEWVPDTRKSQPVWNRNWVAQTLVVPEGGLVEAIELGIYRTRDVRDELQVEIRQVDARGMPEGEVLFSERYDPDMFPAEGEKRLAVIDVSRRMLSVEPGQRLTIAVRNRSSDAYEWWYLDGYPDGKGYVEGSSGWMDWKCDFMFRVNVGKN